MLDPSDPVAKLLARDRRYKFGAYVFIREALDYAHNVLGLGSDQLGEEEEVLHGEPAGESQERVPDRHLTGQELCEAIRRFALEQYGYMAKSVLGNWGLHTTGDFGNIVYNLIEINMMKKTHQDRREDFDDVYDFEVAFRQEFKIAPAEARSEKRSG